MSDPCQMLVTPDHAGGPRVVNSALHGRFGRRLGLCDGLGDFAAGGTQGEEGFDQQINRDARVALFHFGDSGLTGLEHMSLLTYLQDTEQTGSGWQRQAFACRWLVHAPSDHRQAAKTPLAAATRSSIATVPLPTRPPTCVFQAERIPWARESVTGNLVPSSMRGLRSEGTTLFVGGPDGHCRRHCRVCLVGRMGGGGVGRGGASSGAAGRSGGLLF
jgi:hypothetical protein